MSVRRVEADVRRVEADVRRVEAHVGLVKADAAIATSSLHAHYIQYIYIYIGVAGWILVDTGIPYLLTSSPSHHTTSTTP